MVNSNIIQSSDGESLQLDPTNTEHLKDFLMSIDGGVELLQIQHAYINNLNNAEKLSKAYFNNLINELDNFRIKSFTEPNIINPWGNIVEAEIIKMIPLRDKFFELFVTIYDNAGNTNFVHDLFKQLLQIGYNEFENFQHMETYGYQITDNIRNFIYEVFLYTIAYLAKNEKVEEMSYLIITPYQMKCVDDKSSSNPIIQYQSVSFVRFNMPVPSINNSYRRQQKNTSENKSLYADLIVSKFKNSSHIDLNDIINTDILLYFVSLSWIVINHEKIFWNPHTAFYRKQQTHEFMLKAVSKSFFERIKGLFKFKSYEDFNISIPHINGKHRELQSILYYYNLPELDQALNYFNVNKQA